MFVQMFVQRIIYSMAGLQCQQYVRNPLFIF